MPRSASQQSNGPGTAPDPFWMKARRSARSSRRVTSMPPIMSLCPFKYLVVEWRTMSAPKVRGRWNSGVAKVLSTTKRAWALCAMAPAAARSVSRIMGLVGVSTYTILVCLVSAAVISFGSPVSTKVKLRPSRSQIRVMERWVPP